MIKTTINLFRIIGVLFSNKNLTFNEIAKKTKLSVMGVSKIISQLEKEGIVSIEKIGMSKTPRLIMKKDNLEIFALAERFKFNEFIDKHNKLKGFLLTIKDKLNADFSLIFGSYTSGEESIKSDLDLLIVSEKQDIGSLNKAKSLVNIEINPIFIKKKDFINEFRKGHRLYKEISEGKRILINGEYAYWDMIRTL